MSTVVRLHRVTKTFREGGRDRPILLGVDAAIDGGQLVALLGPSGSGKSTLLNLIAGIDIPTAGRIDVFGQDLGRLRETERTIFRRRRIGQLFQSFHLLPTLTIEENVLLPLDLDGRADRAGRERARALCEQVGLADRLQSFPDVLSGGEQQRAALARALVTQPQLLLADEPTGSLDHDNADRVLGMLEEVRRDGRAVVMATHNRDAAARCDRVLRLESGQLRDAATHT